MWPPSLRGEPGPPARDGGPWPGFRLQPPHTDLSCNQVHILRSDLAHLAYLSAPNQVAERSDHMAGEDARSRSPGETSPPSLPPPGRHDALQLIHDIKTTFGSLINANLCLIGAFSGDWAHLAPVDDKHSINVMADFLPWWLKSLHSFVNNIPMTAERVFWRQLVQIGCHLAS